VDSPADLKDKHKCGVNQLAVLKSDSFGQIIWPVFGIFILALCVRLFYLYEIADSPAFNVPIVDARGYDLIASKLVNTAKMPEQFFWQQFFYPLFLSAVYLFSNCSVLVAQIVHAILAAVNCVLTFLLGRRIFNRRTGIVAAIIVAFYGPLIFHEMDLIDVVWVVFWSLVLILLFLKTVTRRRLLWFFLLGLCSALSIITRPNFILFIIAGVVWVGFVLYKARAGIFFSVRCFLLTAFGFIVIALPVAVQNLRVTGHFGILPASGGVNFYIGNNPDFEAAEIRVGTKWERIVDMPEQYGITGDMWQKQRFFYDKVREFIVSDPKGFLKRLANKAIQFVNSRELPGDVDIYLFRQWSNLLEFLMWKVGGFGFPFGLLLPLAVIGFVYNRRRIPMPVKLFVITYPLLIILTHVKTRYRVPMVPVLSVLAVSGCAYLIRSIIERSLSRAGSRGWFRIAGVTCLGAVIVFISTFPGPFIAEKLDYEAELYFNIGRTLQDQGKYSDATQRYIEALDRKPDYIDAHLCLGMTLTAVDKVEDAIEHYRKVIELDPNDHRAHCGLGQAFYSLGKFEDAQHYYTEAIKLKPDYAIAHKGLAMVFHKQNRIDEAVIHYKRSFDLEPDDADTYNTLGMILARQGKFDEAAEYFRDAINIKPDFIEAHKALGMALATMGELGQAVDCFREALQLNPDDVEAHYFMGIILAQKGDIDGAIMEFEKVLQLNPAHQDARIQLNTLLSTEK